MRFHFGSIPDDFTPDGSWRPLREPGPMVMQLIAFPLGALSAFLVGYSWSRLGTTSAVDFGHGNALRLILALLLSFPVLIIVHELLHAVVHPHFGRSSATVIGAWPSRMMFYAHYAGPLTRERFLLVFAFPSLIITVLPLLVAACGLVPQEWLFWAAWYSTWNAFFACGYLFGIVIVLLQIPRAASVRNKSWFTYWKPA